MAALGATAGFAAPAAANKPAEAAAAPTRVGQPAPANAAPLAPSAPATQPTSPTSPRIDLAPPIRPALPAAPGASGPRAPVFAWPAEVAIVSALDGAMKPPAPRSAFNPLGPGDIVSGAAASRPAVPRPPAASRDPFALVGELRTRVESRSLLDYRLPGTFGRAATQTLAQPGDFSIARTRFGASMNFARGVNGQVTLQQVSTLAGAAPGSSLSGNVELHDAWLDLDSLGTQPLQLRLGRQGLSYGEGRVLSAADWDNAPRAYDGARVCWSPGRARIESFVAWSGEGRPAAEGRAISGIDALWRARGGFEAEAYQFRRAFRYPSWRSELGTMGRLDDATSGLRTRLQRGPFELRLEGARQRGRRAGDDVRSWLGVARVTVDMESSWNTKFFAEHLSASGDSVPTDGTFQRFDPVSWGNHDFQGAADVTGESNLSDWGGGFTAQPSKGWTVRSEYHTFALNQPRDAWVDDEGNTLRRDPAGASGTALGHELDATLRWDTRSRVSLLLGASRFWRGDFVRRSGGGKDVRWGFAQVSIGL